MATLKLEELSKKMRNLDICMLSSQSAGGEINARPMSNNGDVEYDGNSFFFTNEDSDVVKDLEDNHHLSLSFSNKDKLFIAVIGEAELIRDRQEMKPHWNEGLDKWFEDGLNTPGLVMIHAKASKIRYWEGENNGEIVVQR